MQWPLWILTSLAAAALAACVAPPAPTSPTAESGSDSPSPSPVYCRTLEDLDAHAGCRIETFPGNGTFLLEPAAPVLVPGIPLVLNLTFTNPDIRTYFFYEPRADCADGPLAIGTSPVRWFTTATSLSFNWLIVHSCPPASYQGIAPHETGTWSYAWNGSIDLWDHASVETGQDWVKRTYWAGPGDWPLMYGLSDGTSYDTSRETTVRVEQNSLNAGSPLRLSACSLLGRSNVTLDQARLTTSAREAKLGTPISVDLHYTLHLPAPGCYLFTGEPNVVAKASTSPRGISLGHTCSDGISSDNLFQGIVHAATSDVDAHIRFAWDGRSRDQTRCHPAASAGEYNLTFSGFAASFGRGFPAPAAPPTATFRWLPE